MLFFLLLLVSEPLYRVIPPSEQTAAEVAELQELLNPKDVVSAIVVRFNPAALAGYATISLPFGKSVTFTGKSTIQEVPIEATSKMKKTVLEWKSGKARLILERRNGEPFHGDLWDGERWYVIGYQASGVQIIWLPVHQCLSPLP